MRGDRAALTAALPLRAAAITAGFGGMIHYDTTPSGSGSPASTIPAAFPASVLGDQPVLFMAAHPRCPCTRAGISELARLMARCSGRLTAHVLFLSPGDRRHEWARTDLWRRAAAIPGVTVHDDEDGRDAQSLGLDTSGHVVVYDRLGMLVFSGGITPSRGHEGDNEGSAIVAALAIGDGTTARRAPATTPVFGCSLFPARSR